MYKGRLFLFHFFSTRFFMKGQATLLSCNDEKQAQHQNKPMDNLLKKITNISSPSHPHPATPMYKILYPFTWTIVVLALITGTFLLVSDLFPVHLSHMPLSAAPLLLIGAAYLAFQVLIRAQPLDLFKALIVSSAFILWGLDQLLPSGWFATTLGDVVIVLYVIDLGWMMMDRLKQQWQSRHSQPEKLVHENILPLPTLDKSMPLLIPHSTLTDQQSIPKRPGATARNTPILKRNRLKPLSCTCTSPLAPLQSTLCCCQMKEVARH